MILQTPAKLAQVNLDQNQIVNFERQELEGAESASKGSAHRYGTSGQEVTVTATQHQHAEMMVQPEGATSTLMTQLTEYATTGWVDSQLSLTTRDPDDGTFSVKAYMGHNDKNLIVKLWDIGAQSRNCRWRWIFGTI